MQTVILQMVGVQPLMVNSPDLSNPLNPLAREISTYTSKRKKSEDDLKEILRLKWLGSLYHDKEIGPYLPADSVFMSLLQAARLTKEGKVIERGGLMLGTETRFPIQYDGPRDPAAMYQDGRFVDIRSAKPPGQGRIQASRVIFPKWAVDASFLWDRELLDLQTLEKFAEAAGRMIGVGTYRLRFGRYSVQVVLKQQQRRSAAQPSLAQQSEAEQSLA